MFTFILILLLVAAIFGVLGAVLQFALVLVLGLILAVTLLAWGSWLWFKHQMRAWQKEADRQIQQDAHRRRAIDVRYVENQADGERSDRLPRELADGEPTSTP